MRKGVISLLFVGILTSLVLAQSSPNKPAKDEWAKPIQKAGRFITLLSQSRFDSATAMFDAQMKKALPSKKLKSLWQTLQQQVGTFQRQGSVRTEMVQNYHVVYVTCQFKEGTLDAKVVFDTKNKIAGLFFVPHQEAKSYQAPEYVNPDAFTEIDTLKLPTTWRLPASLSLPNGGGPFPAIVLVHGSGPADRDETIGPNKPFRDLAWGLASRGIAVLRYEKRTKIYPHILDSLKGRFTVMQETMEDALSAASLLRNIGKIDPKRIILLGHSLGGYLIPRMATLDPRLAGFIIMAGPARPLTEIIPQQYRYIFNLDGKIDESEQKKLRQIDSLMARIQSPAYLNSARPMDIVFGAPPAYWKDLANYNLPKIAFYLRKPALVLQGGKDYQVTKKDFDLWKTYLKNNPKATFKWYPDLSHLFIKTHGVPSPGNYEHAGHVDKRVIEDIALWIKKNFPSR